MSLPEFSAYPQSELSISPEAIDALRGRVSDPTTTTSYKPGPDYNKTVTVRLGIEGPAMYGLTDWKDNKEWSGITNHVLLSARYAVYFAQQMAQAGHSVNPQRVLDGMIVSHAGRRISDEAGWYYKAVDELIGKTERMRRRGLSNESLGMELVQDKVPQHVFDLVVALGHNVERFEVDPAIYNSWDFLISIYADHRTTQRYEALNTRMGDFLLGYFFDKDNITQEKRFEVYATLENLIERQKTFRLGQINTQEVTIDEADQIAESLGAQPDSPRLSRRELMRLILQDADTETMLIQAGIDPNSINEVSVPVPEWEDDFRMQYVKSASGDIISKLNERHKKLLESIEDPNTFNKRWEEELRNLLGVTWWSIYAEEIWLNYLQSGSKVV